jgi:hypothetical protein
MDTGEVAAVQRWAPLQRVAGVAALLLVAAGMTALALYAVSPPPVSGGRETLLFIQQHAASYIAQQLLWLIPSVLGLIVFVALYMTLRGASPVLALLGLTVGGASWIALLAVPVTSVGTLSLVYLSDEYAAAETGTARASYATAAEALIAENNTVSLAGALTPLGVLLISLAIIRGPFPHWIGWVVIVTGALGLAAETLRFAVTALYTVYGPLLWFWFAAVGVALLLAGRKRQAAPIRPWPTRP